MYDESQEQRRKDHLGSFGKSLPRSLPCRPVRFVQLTSLRVEFDQILLFFHSNATHTDYEAGNDRHCLLEVY